MARLHESSGLISLAELRRQDTERSQKLAEEARAQAEVEQRARVLADRERARDAELRAATASGAARQAAEAQRAELDELERARAAELQRAEREARARRELELCLAEERNARRQAEVLLLARAARARLLNLFSGALCVATWLGTAIFYLGLVRPEAEHARAARESALLDAQHARRDADATNAHAREREAVLGERASSLEQAVRDAHASRDTPPASLPGTPGKRGRTLPTRNGASDVTPQGGPCRDDGDPLNPCLARRSSPAKPL